MIAARCMAAPRLHAAVRRAVVSVAASAAHRPRIAALRRGATVQQPPRAPFSTATARASASQPAAAGSASAASGSAEQRKTIGGDSADPKRVTDGAGASNGDGASSGGAGEEEEEQQQQRRVPRSGWVLGGLASVSCGYALSLILYFPEPCKIALASAEGDERVVKTLGVPLRPVWPWRWTGDAGTGHLTSHAGYASFSIPFTAPKGRGEITARLVLNPKTAKWERFALVVSGYAAADAGTVAATSVTGNGSGSGSSNGSGEQQIYIELPSELPAARPPPGSPAADAAAAHAHAHAQMGVSPLHARGDPHAPFVAPAPAMADAWAAAHDAVVKAHGAAVTLPHAAAVAPAPAAAPTNSLTASAPAPAAAASR